MDRSSPSSPFESPNPHRLYRNPERGVCGGVCAGIADYFGIGTGLVRLLVVAAGLFFFTLPVLIGYVAALVLLPVKPAQIYRTAEDEMFWRSVSTKPDRTLAGLTQRFRDFEKRVISLEAHVASKEFELNRAIRDLDR